jgi:hypothetical protein
MLAITLSSGCPTIFFRNVLQTFPPSRKGDEFITIVIVWIFLGRPLILFRSVEGVQIINGPKFLEEKFNGRGMF